VKPGDVLALVQRLAGAWPVPLVMAIAEKESGRHDARGVLVDFNDRAFLADRNGGSIGLFQLDLATARDRGYRGDAAGLYDPKVNTTLAVLQLDWIADTLRRRAAFGVQSLIAAYNEGVGNVMRGNPDPRYVGMVEAYRERWRLALGEGVT
jgi:soluble lytic murein transglycosylase-like protein